MAKSVVPILVNLPAELSDLIEARKTELLSHQTTERVTRHSVIINLLYDALGKSPTAGATLVQAAPKRIAKY